MHPTASLWVGGYESKKHWLINIRQLYIAFTDKKRKTHLTQNGGEEKVYRHMMIYAFLGCAWFVVLIDYNINFNY